MNKVHEEDVNGFKIKIYVDESPENPRKDCDPLGTMLYTSRQYTLGDKQVSSEYIEETMADPDLLTWPVYAYIHGGTVLSLGPFNDPWDSGQCGIVYAPKKKVAEWFGWKKYRSTLKQKAEEVLKHELDTFQRYLNGDVFGFVIEDPDGEHVDSCWGFYEDPDDLVKTVKAEHDFDVLLKEWKDKEANEIVASMSGHTTYAGAVE